MTEEERKAGSTAVARGPISPNTYVAYMKRYVNSTHTNAHACANI